MVGWTALALAWLVLAVGCSSAGDARNDLASDREQTASSSNSPAGAASYGWSYVMKFDGVTYEGALSESLGAGRPLKKEDLGAKFAEIRRDASNEGIGYRLRDGDAAYLKPGAPVYAVEGYDTSFRLAARVDGRLTTYEAVSNPSAEKGSDLLDVGEKVNRISIHHQEDIGQRLGSIEDPEKARSLVRGLMDTPVEQAGFGYFGSKNVYLVVLHLKDGTAVVRDYRMDTGRLGSSGVSAVVTPEGFRESVEEALEGFLKKREAVRKARAAKEQRELRACDSTRTTDGTRTIDRGIPYKTNDVRDGPTSGVLRGTDGRDRLAGENGEDRVYGLGGDDIVEGGLCDDEVHGGPGNDEMMGAGGMDPNENGDDTLYGGPGKDNISGDRGDDVIFGGGGDDEALYGATGEDTIYGGAGKDFVDGLDRSRDRLHCGAGRDRYTADQTDVVADDCEEKAKIGVSGSY